MYSNQKTVAGADILEIKEKLDSLTDVISDLSSPPEQIILNNQELPILLKVSKKTLQKWRDTGIISFSKIGREIFYKLSDVIETLDAHRQERVHKR